jgi:hypothetical protein
LAKREDVKTEGELTAQERLFCALYRQTRNGREAAAQAGYCKKPHKVAVELLARESIRRELTRAEPEGALRAEVLAGYRRLAFGMGTDALRLLFADTDEPPTPEALAEMDIFNICDIKRPKGGGLEVKFFDRCEALRRLEALGGAAENEVGEKSFYAAIERSVQTEREEVAGE